jgi:hypothetical protein
MKINRHETHDRLTEFKKQKQSISECCEDLIKQRPFGNNAFYIFAHARTDDDGFTKRLIWQPRLTKPKAQTNSMLFKAYPGSDTIKVIWIIPDRILWPQFQMGNITENETVLRSIFDFQNNRQILESREDDDLSDAQIDMIYAQMSNKINPKPYKKI